jgi:hypothetical protein
MLSSVWRRCCARVGLALGSAPDGYIEWPYRPPGVPARLRGRAEIRSFLTGAAKAFVRFDEYRDYINPLPLAEALASGTQASG